MTWEGSVNNKLSSQDQAIKVLNSLAGFPRAIHHNESLGRLSEVDNFVFCFLLVFTWKCNVQVHDIYSREISVYISKHKLSIVSDKKMPKELKGRVAVEYLFPDHQFLFDHIYNVIIRRNIAHRVPQLWSSPSTVHYLHTGSLWWLSRDCQWLHPFWGKTCMMK